MEYKLMQMYKDRNKNSICYLCLDRQNNVCAMSHRLFNQLDYQGLVDKSDKDKLLRDYNKQLELILNTGGLRLKYIESVIDFALFYMHIVPPVKIPYEQFINDFQSQLNKFSYGNKDNKLKFSHQYLLTVHDTKNNKKINIKKGDYVLIKLLGCNEVIGKVENVSLDSIYINGQTINLGYIEHIEKRKQK